MTHQAPPAAASAGADPGRQIAQLRELLGLVRSIAGQKDERRIDDSVLEAAASISSAYDRSLPIVQRRFDSLAAETALWAAAGVEALLAAGEAPPPRAAAERLAFQLESALGEMAALLD